MRPVADVVHVVLGTVFDSTQTTVQIVQNNSVEAVRLGSDADVRGDRMYAPRFQAAATAWRRSSMRRSTAVMLAPLMVVPRCPLPATYAAPLTRSVVTENPIMS
jgi:hypothetical protein